MARILLTDGEQRSTLAATRSLGRAGHHVLVAGRTERTLAAASRYCRGRIVLPSTDRTPDAWTDAIGEAVTAHSVDILLPMTDRAATLVLAARERMPDTVVPFPDRDIYDRASDKRRLLELAGSLGVPVPRQVVVDGPDAVAAGALSALGTPIVLKPWRSVVHDGARLVQLSVAIAAGPDEALDHLRTLPPEAFPVLAQSHVSGPGLGVFVLADDGEIVASFAHRRIREKPPTGGVSTYRESVPVPPDLLGYARSLLGELRWTGVAMVEFKEESSTATPYLMEINGRFWGSLQLSIDAGVDFPAMLVALTLGNRPAPIDTYRLGVRSRWLLGDLDHLLWLWRAPTAKRRAVPGLPGPLGGLGRMLVPWRPGDRWEVLRPTDPYPFLREIRTWIRDSTGR